MGLVGTPREGLVYAVGTDSRKEEGGKPVVLEYLDEFLVGDGGEPRHLFKAQAQVVKGYEFRRAPGFSFQLVTSLFKHLVKVAHLLACLQERLCRFLDILTGFFWSITTTRDVEFGHVGNINFSLFEEVDSERDVLHVICWSSCLQMNGSRTTNLVKGQSRKEPSRSCYAQRVGTV